MGISDASATRLAEQLAASGTSPSGRLVRKELRERMRAALDRLASGDREVILLRHLEQLSHKEIADILSISPGAARTRYCRAVERLHDLLSSESGTL